MHKLRQNLQAAQASCSHRPGDMRRRDHAGTTPLVVATDRSHERGFGHGGGHGWPAPPWRKVLLPLASDCLCRVQQQRPK